MEGLLLVISAAYWTLWIYERAYDKGSKEAKSLIRQTRKDVKDETINTP